MDFTSSFPVDSMNSVFKRSDITVFLRNVLTRAKEINFFIWFWKIYILVVLQRCQQFHCFTKYYFHIIISYRLLNSNSWWVPSVPATLLVCFFSSVRYQMPGKFILLIRFALAIKFLNLAFQPVRACSIYSDLRGFHTMERNGRCTGGCPYTLCKE
jgi:hypothetical protein